MDKTVHHADFAGRRRRFCLRIGEVAELERLGKAGIGAIALRLATLTYYASDVWDAIRLGLQGGGEVSMLEADALVQRYQAEPIGDYLGLAADIVGACINGIPKAEEQAPGKPSAEGPSPATSPPSTAPAPRPAGLPPMSTA